MTSNTLPLRTVAGLVFLPPNQGTVIPLYAATATQIRQNLKEYKWKFLVPPGKVNRPNPVASDDRQAKGLWENKTKEVNKYLVTSSLPPLQAW